MMAFTWVLYFLLVNKSMTWQIFLKGVVIVMAHVWNGWKKRQGTKTEQKVALLILWNILRKRNLRKLLNVFKKNKKNQTYSVYFSL